jgi:ribosomal protein S18 acetylase RimI-like enzyme
LELRPFVPADAPGLRALLEKLGWAARYVQGQADSLDALYRDPHGLALVALDGPALIGFVTALFAPWNQLTQVHGLAVVLAYRRRGVASALIAAAEDFARQHGGRGVFVDTPVDNHTARAFYLANGFAEAYVMPEYYAEGLDGVTYLKLFKPS